MITQLEPYSIRVDRNPYNVPQEDWLLMTGAAENPVVVATCQDEEHAKLFAAAPEGHALLEFILEHVEANANCVPLHALFGDDSTSFRNAVLAYFAKVK